MIVPDSRVTLPTLYSFFLAPPSFHIRFKQENNLERKEGIKEEEEVQERKDEEEKSDRLG